MRSVLALIFILSTQVYAKEQLVIPEKYQEKKELLKERERVIPKDANKATSAGAFTGKILEYHLADVLKENKITKIKSMKTLESSLNQNMNFNSKFLNLNSKFDMNRLRAQIDIESVINTQLWTENSFQTLRAQMKLYETSYGDISLQNRTNNEDSRSYLNIEKTW